MRNDLVHERVINTIMIIIIILFTMWLSNNSHEKVKAFMYLGFSMTNRNSIHEEIRCRLKSGIDTFNIMFQGPMGRFQLELIYYFTYFSTVVLLTVRRDDGGKIGKIIN